MLVRDFIIVLILFGLVTGIGYLVVEDVASSDKGYDVENMTNPDYQERYDTLTDTTTVVYQMQNATASKEGLSVVSTYTTMFKSTFSVIGLVFGSFGIVTSTLSNFAQDLGMSSGLANLLVGAVFTIIITIIVFIVISSVSRGRL